MASKTLAKDHQLEVVTWYDHWGRNRGGWTNLEDLETPKAAIMKTVGWVIQENDQCMVLSSDLDKGLNDGVIKSFTEQCILKCAIKSRKKIKEPA